MSCRGGGGHLHAAVVATASPASTAIVNHMEVFVAPVLRLSWRLRIGLVACFVAPSERKQA